MVKFIKRGSGGDEDGDDEKSKWKSLMDRTHKAYRRIWGNEEIPSDRDGEGR